jgi:hypothetical protein
MSISSVLKEADHSLAGVTHYEIYAIRRNLTSTLLRHSGGNAAGVRQYGCQSGFDPYPWSPGSFSLIELIPRRFKIGFYMVRIIPVIRPLFEIHGIWNGLEWGLVRD